LQYVRRAVHKGSTRNYGYPQFIDTRGTLRAALSTSASAMSSATATYWAPVGQSRRASSWRLLRTFRRTQDRRTNVSWADSLLTGGWNSGVSWRPTQGLASS